MNKKGMTLIEMVVSILILSISTLTLLGGFSAVIRIMGNSSRIKNNSDMLLSYAEDTGDRAIKDKVEVNSKTVNYKISSTSEFIDVSKEMNTLNVKDNDEVYLRVLDMKHGQTKVKNTEVYKTFKNQMDSLYSKIKTAKKDFDETSIEGFESSANTIFKPIYIEMNSQWPQFPKKLLPKTYQNKLAEKPLYVVPYYPWVIKMGDAQYENNDLLILTSEHNLEIDTNTYPKENIHLIYDYTKETWYYNETDSYSIEFVESTTYGKTVFFSGKGFILDLKSVKDIITNPDYGWKVLDIEAEYDETNPDSFWKDVQ